MLLPRRLTLLACLVAAALIACLPHAGHGEMGETREYDDAAHHSAPVAVGEVVAGQVAAAQAPAARAAATSAPALAADCADSCLGALSTDEASAAAIACLMAAVAALGALALLHRRPVVFPARRLLSVLGAWALTPALPRPPSLVVLGISRT